MRILYVTCQSPWPIDTGSRVRSYHIVDALSRNHEVVIALANLNQAEVEDFMGDEGADWSRHVAGRAKRTVPRRVSGMLFSRHQSPFKTKNRNKFHEDLLRWVKDVKPDLIWYFQARSFWQTGCAPGTASVYDMDDMESVRRARQLKQQPILRRLAGVLDNSSFRHAERTLMNAADLVTVSNPEDEATIRSLTHAQVLHLPNGFDFASEPPIVPRRSNRVLFYGVMSYRPAGEGLLWFCDKIWPLIRQAEPDTVLDAVGQYDKRMERIGTVPGVTLHGYVGSLDQLIAQSALLVVPLRIGSGTRIKILEAWAKGLPVVTTSIGCEGLGAIDDNTLLIGDSPELFAEQCLRLLAEPELGARLATQAHSYARGRFDWSLIYPTVGRAVELASE